MARDANLTLNQIELFPSLRIMQGKGSSSQRIPVIGDRLVIGRRRGDLVLPDPEISGQHAEIVRTPTGYLIRDLGSTNGTFLNGQSVKEAPLQAGDQIGVGQTLFTWEVPAPGVHAPETSVAPETVDQPRIPVGIYDTMPDYATLGALVEDAVVGFSDPDGSHLLDLEGAGVNLNLPPRSVVQLEVLAGPEKGRLVTLASGNVVIGRYGTDVVLKDSDVSRRHLTIEAFGRDQIFMRDLGSTNGSYVNGTRVSFSKLQSGDTVVVGRSVMQLVVKDT